MDADALKRNPYRPLSISNIFTPLAPFQKQVGISYCKRLCPVELRKRIGFELLPHGFDVRPHVRPGCLADKVPLGAVTLQTCSSPCSREKSYDGVASAVEDPVMKIRAIPDFSTTAGPAKHHQTCWVCPPDVAQRKRRTQPLPSCLLPSVQRPVGRLMRVPMQLPLRGFSSV
jgi:hypothetical protein